jgi:hypothetical protein
MYRHLAIVALVVAMGLSASTALAQCGCDLSAPTYTTYYAPQTVYYAPAAPYVSYYAPAPVYPTYYAAPYTTYYAPYGRYYYAPVWRGAWRWGW